MEALYKVKANELDNLLIESIIRVTSGMDETDYLTMYSANEEHLSDNLAAEPSAKFSGDEFREYVNKSN